MDGTRFDRLTRTLTTTGSRRRALGGLLSGALGVLSSGAEHTTAKKKKPCPPCKKRKQGKCKKKLPDGTACQSGTCQGGSCVATTWPAVCPVCQACNSGSGSCAVDTSENGEAGAGCAAPKVCCSGKCCSGVHACNVASSCATCAEVCDANGAFCSNLAQVATRGPAGPHRKSAVVGRAGLACTPAMTPAPARPAPRTALRTAHSALPWPKPSRGVLDCTTWTVPRHAHPLPSARRTFLPMWKG